jgi:hypothetical protein
MIYLSSGSPLRQGRSTVGNRNEVLTSVARPSYLPPLVGLDPELCALPLSERVAVSIHGVPAATIARPGTNQAGKSRASPGNEAPEGAEKLRETAGRKGEWEVNQDFVDDVHQQDRFFGRERRCGSRVVPGGMNSTIRVLDFPVIKRLPETLSHPPGGKKSLNERGYS